MGISYEQQGLLLNAIEKYQKSVYFDQDNWRSLKLLGSAQLGNKQKCCLIGT